MKLHATPLAGAILVQTDRSVDHRGTFARFFCEHELSEILEGQRIVQINHSTTNVRGAVRGMHYQHPPHAEMKLIRCLRGRVWDVALDLRAGSPTFLRWHAEELAPDNGRMFVIPQGFAHGFQALEPGSELLYLHTSAYDPQSEAGVDCRDPLLGIEWPLPVTELSGRDLRHPPLHAGFQGISL